MAQQQLAVTITATTTAALRQMRDDVRGADLVELRLDGVRDLDAAGALAGRTCRVIVTCRPRWEGGRFDGSEEERRRLLEQAAALGADYVDVEWRAAFARELVDSRKGRGVILSNHDFDGGVPADLRARAAAMRATGAEVVKLAIRSTRLCDALTLADNAPPGARVLVAMGPLGLPTRLLPARFGSCWTYAGAPALGQPTVQDLFERFGWGAHSAAAAVYGIAGAPLSHSISPVLHNTFFRAVGLDAVYVPLEAASADDFLAFADSPLIRLAGASITAPYKVSLLSRLHSIDAEAREAGAVNTIRRDGSGRWEGTNTDIAGFLAPLPPDVGPTTRGAILGGGGAARAVAAGLRRRRVAVTVYVRHDVGAADRPFVDLGASVRRGLPDPGSWDVLVNATPVGTSPRVSETPLPADRLPGGGLVYDLVYNPAITRLLRDAMRAGCRTIGGLDMLVAQAEQQAVFWTGRCPPEGVMRKAAHDTLSLRDWSGNVEGCEQVACTRGEQGSP
jgi:3-dehydroquinate dehydratase / shikimate dehydrogenase